MYTSHSFALTVDQDHAVDETSQSLVPSRLVAESHSRVDTDLTVPSTGGARLSPRPWPHPSRVGWSRHEQRPRNWPKSGLPDHPHHDEAHSRCTSCPTCGPSPRVAPRRYRTAFRHVLSDASLDVSPHRWNRVWGRLGDARNSALPGHGPAGAYLRAPAGVEARWCLRPPPGQTPPSCARRSH